MIISENCYIQKDIEQLADNFDANFLYNKSILITGANGLIGGEIVFFLAYLNKKFNANIKIFAFVRNENKAKEKFKSIIDSNFLKIIIQDINKQIIFDKKIDYIIHGASITSSKQMLENPIETIMTTINGTKNILDLAKDKKIKSMVFLSSLEVYGNLKSDIEIKEDFVGAINSLNPRSSYPLGKKIAENLCVAYSNEYDLDIKIARLTQTFGAGVNFDDSRVFAQFAKSVIEQKDIILHTEGNTVRNYCYLTDAVSAILTILKSGEKSNAYNVANKNTAISIKDFANLVAKKYNLKVKYELDNINRGYNPEIKMVLNTEKLEILNWSAKIDLEQMIESLINGIRK